MNNAHFGLACEICYHQLTPETCAIDVEGVKWDVCAGECARQAGIIENPQSKPTSRRTTHEPC